MASKSILFCVTLDRIPVGPMGLIINCFDCQKVNNYSGPLSSKEVNWTVQVSQKGFLPSRQNVYLKRRITK